MTPRFAAYIAPAQPRAQIWRTAAGLVVTAAVYLVLIGLGFAIHTVLFGAAQTRGLLSAMSVSSTPATLLLVLITFLPMIIGLAVACRWLHKRRLGSLIGPGPRALRDFSRAIVVFGVIYGVGLTLYLIFGSSQRNLPIGIWLSLLPLTALALLIQTGAEELLFRGYLQQQLAARSARPLIWAVLPSILFGLLHFDPARLGETAPYAVIGATVFGLMAADLTARSGSLGAAWGAHFANNFFAVALLSVDGTLTGLALRVTDYRVDDLTPGPWLAATDLLPMVLAWWVLRRWIVTA